MPTNREQWFADVLRAGLETKVLAEPDILAHATPAVLIQNLPKDLLVKVFDAGLATGTMSPTTVVQNVPPDDLAAHVPPGVIWACIAAAAERAGIPSGETAKRGNETAARDFVRRVIDDGLVSNVMTPQDVVHHVNAKVLGHFPEPLTIRLLEASLKAGKMNPELIIDTLGTVEIAKHAPTEVTWACIARIGERSVSDRAATVSAPNMAERAVTVPGVGDVKPGPRLEFLDEDDVASVILELDEQPSPPKRPNPPTAKP
jgi:hypothetical protein